jgi:hypothetical protein
MFGTYGKIKFDAIFDFNFTSIDFLPRSLSKNERAMISKKKRKKI